MAETDLRIVEADGIKIDLKNRYLAAVLAWAFPGLGHFYQQRYAKGTLYAVCIMTTYILGFAVGGAHVVYASMTPGDRRWHYACQLGVGVVTLPALWQTMRLNQATERISRPGQPPFFRTRRDFVPAMGGWMSPPRRPVSEQSADEVAAWYARKGAGYEMGTWYTMIAGLLNILVIYDAMSGPLIVPGAGRRKEEDQDDTQDASGPEVRTAKTVDGKVTADSNVESIREPKS